MNSVYSRLGLMALVLVAGTVASAQSTTTGAIYGTVTDKNGAKLAGVTITVSSGQITRSAVTDADGGYRLSLLNPGSYSVTVAKGGYTTIKQKVDVSVNETRGFSPKMAQETGTVVEVVASAAAQIDTTTTQTGANFTMDSIASIPMGRDMNTVTNFAPGVVDSGFAGLGASISGASGAENAYVLDGLATTDMRYGGIGNTLVTDFIDQVEVQTGGFKPEFSALGGVFNAVTKSGTNSFHGSSWFTWDPRGIIARPKRTETVVQGNPLARYDLGAEVSGPIIKDKLFYFVGVSGQVREAPEVSTNNSGFTGSDRKITNYQLVGKINWFVNQDLQFTLFMNHNPYKDKVDRAYGNYGSANFGRTLEGYSRGVNLSVDWTISPSLFFSAKIGQSVVNDEEKPVSMIAQLSDRLWFYTGTLPGGVTAPQPNAGLYGISTTYARGGYGLFSNEQGKSDQLRLDLSWFLGTHSFKFGFSQTTASYKIQDDLTGGYRYTLLRTSGSPTGFAAVRDTFNNIGEVKSVYQALYLQDTWEIISGLKAAYGVRMESQNHKDSNGNSFMKFKFNDALQPRLGLIWDVNNDGKTKLSANYAIYYEALPQRLSIRQQANEVYLRERFPLTAYSPTGLGTLNMNAGYAKQDFATPFSKVPIQLGLKLPRRSEFILGWDQQLDGGFMVGVHAKRRKMTNVIEDGTPWNYNDVDGGEAVDWGIAPGYGQAILMNPKPGVMQWWSKPGSISNTVQGKSQLMSWNSTYPEAYNTYESVDFTVEHKSERAYVSGSLTWSRLFGTYEGLVSSTNGQADANITASWDYPIYWGEGDLPLDRTLAAKIQASYNWTLGPGKLSAGIAATLTSGSPISMLSNGQDGLYADPSKKVIDYGGYGDVIPVDNKLGQFGRTPTITNVDFHLDYTYKAGKFSIIPSFDIFNMANTRQITGVNQLWTDANGLVTGRWGLPTGFQGPRSYRGGVKVKF